MKDAMNASVAIVQTLYVQDAIAEFVTMYATMAASPHATSHLSVGSM